MFAIEVREHRSKLLALGGFIIALSAVGFFAGRIFTHTSNQRAGSLRIIFFACVFFTFPTAMANAQQARSSKPIARLEIDPPEADKLARIRWVLDANGGNASRGALLSLAITHIEKKMTVFAVDRIPVEGEFSMNFHFVDGAEHRVSAQAQLSDGRSVRSQQVVAVSGGEPPLSAMLPAMGLFLAVISLGLAVGRWSRSRRTPS